ncbi:MAG TPA: hypothetical protein VKR29_02720, partial [Candidatus Binataceae bacterium]|nr:hypothetical protein [Candidatus Binataceae bacterium]
MLLAIRSQREARRSPPRRIRHAAQSLCHANSIDERIRGDSWMSRTKIRAPSHHTLEYALIDIFQLRNAERMK